MALHCTRHNDDECVKCPCGKPFGRKSELNRHVEQTHGGRKHSCPVHNCPFKTPRSGKVKEHLKKKHGITEGAMLLLLALAFPRLASAVLTIFEGEQRRRNANTYRNIERFSGYSRQEGQASITLQEHHGGPPVQNTTQTFAGAASTNAVFGSGHWVPDSEVQRFEIPPQHLQLSRSTEIIPQSTTRAAARAEESSVANEILGATEMLSLRDDNGHENITSWMEFPFGDGWVPQYSEAMNEGQYFAPVHLG
ncbi:hypothetical protein IFR05_003691 [Cadophora sp. M221]|nr:hypothetical protein IFR05_003691 [Cadophora sp. M221]